MLHAALQQVNDQGLTVGHKYESKLQTIDLISSECSSHTAIQELPELKATEPLGPTD